MNPYEVLEVLPDATQDALRDAYRRLVRLHHPDLAANQGRREQANVNMQRINQAWQLVGDVEKRAEYDDKNKGIQRDEVLRRETVQKPPSADVKKTTSASRTHSRHSSLRSREGASNSVTRHRLKKLKKVRTPDEIRLRNQIKLLEARQFWEAGKIADAIASCQSVLRNDFRNVAAREILGDIYLSIGDKSKALVLFEQAFALQKGSSLGQKIAEIRGLKVQPVVESKKEDEWGFDVMPPQNLSLWRRLRAKLRHRR